MLDRLSHHPEQTALYVLAFAGVLALLLNAFVNATALAAAGSVLVGVSFILWGAAHIFGREWASLPDAMQGRIVPTAFILVGIFALAATIADLTVV